MKVNTTNKLYIQIYEKIKDDIISGYLKPHDRILSIKKASDIYKVSKTSVEHAYQKLVDEGWLYVKNRSGYYVEEFFTFRKKRIVTPIENADIKFDLRSNSMEYDLFDLRLWKKYLKEALEYENLVVSYGDCQGEELLRKTLIDYAYKVRGAYSDYQHVVVASSVQSLLYVLCGLLDKSYVIAMEEGAFNQAYQVFLSYGFKIVLLPLDKAIDMNTLLYHQVDVLYVNSIYSCMDMSLKKSLIHWSKTYHKLIIEDDHNGELRYQSKALHCMQGLDGGEHVVYLGSFSRLMIPSIRISYMILNDNLQQKYMKSKQSFSPMASKIEQIAFARYIEDGHLLRYIKKLTKHYYEKCCYMGKLLEQYFKSYQYKLIEASLEYHIDYPCSDTFLKKLNDEGIFVGKTSHNKLVLSFAAIKMDQMESVLKIIISYMNSS